jgi:L-threonylcarbamoyladenylate synthase
MPHTLHLDPTQEGILHAALLLREGRLVAFPTETVYGLGANGLDSAAVARIFAAKQRPAWDPLIVHIASLAQLAAITEIPLSIASRISKLSAFWPGPLTLLLPRSAAIPEAVTAGRSLVGVRIPAHPVARALFEAAGIPIAAPSANVFGHTSPTTAAHVLADLDGCIDAVLDAGPTIIGLESTVLDPTQTPMVLYRPGAITSEQLSAAAGVPVSVFQAESASKPPAALPSPGVGIRHYAPRARLLLIEPNDWSQEAVASAHEESVGVMLPNDWSVRRDAAIFHWGLWQDSAALAARLFAGLRDLDDRGVTLILCPLPPEGGLNDATRDRLQKAARPR